MTEQDLPVLIPETEVPHFTVQAGLATATGKTGPEQEDEG